MLRVFFVVMQQPLYSSKNFKLMPERGFWGWATLMSNSYVIRDIQLQFYSQLIYAVTRDDIQNHIVTSANLSVIAEVLAELTTENPAPPNIIIFPPPPYEPILPPETHIQFVLEPDVIAQVITQYIPMYATPEVEYAPVEEPPPNGSLDTEKYPPIPPAPPGFPPNGGLPGSDSRFIISSPYDGVDDGGKTYVPPFLPPWEGDDGQDPSKLYTVTVVLQPKNESGASSGVDQVRVLTNVPGKITGLGTENASNSDAGYGVLSNGTLSIAGYLGLNYQFKIAWPYPNFTSYFVAQIVSVLKQN